MGAMVRAVGIDPGTVSFGLCGIEGDQVFLDVSIPSAEIAADPQVLVNLLQSVAPVDMIVGPSGYGLPWVSAQDLDARQMDLMLLSDNRDRGRTTIVGGMRRMLRLLKESGLPIIFAPAVIHLPTVPQYRKVNRIDMGTADKLCAVALGIYDQSRHLDIAYEETSFVYVELGGAFTAIVTVDGGQVVDGLGGTAGSLGYLSLGGMDGELAYLLGGFHKELLCSGGVASIAGRSDARPEELAAAAQTDDRSRWAWEAFMESLVKGVAAAAAVVPAPREILLSGRLSRVPAIRRELITHLSVFALVRQVDGFAREAKEAAQGAALIAEGLAGGVYSGLVDTMRLREASGTILDHLYVGDSDEVRRRYLGRSVTEETS
jgi:predicted butyrate kinase (DUF1464 family)